MSKEKTKTFMSNETKAFMSKTKVFCTFFLYFAHLALTFTMCKLGCTSAVQIKKMIFFFVLRSVCTNFHYVQVRLRFGMTKKKTRFFLCHALTLH